MTRRDTIISAALINAGLLVILFVCSLGIDQSIENSVAHASFIPAIQTMPESPSTSPLSSTLTLSSDALSHEIVIGDSSLTKEIKPEAIVVQKGDRLESLAKAYGVSVESLVETNHLSSTQLVVGQRLNMPSMASKSKSEVALTEDLPPRAVSIEQVKPEVPVKKVAAPSVKTAPKLAAAKPATSGTPQYHYVQKGESPWLIAKKYGISVDSLLKLNHLDEATARRLREGDRLRVR